MIVQKLKGFKLRLNKIDSNELESYTLIHLNDLETELFLREIGIKKEDFEQTKTINYKTGDSVITLFTKFADEHRQFKNNFDASLNKNYSYLSPIKGKWCLERNIKCHSIALIKRNNNNNDLNHICIDDFTMHSFCKACMLCRKPNNKKWLSIKDGVYYDYWANYMNEKYLRDKKL